MRRFTLTKRVPSGKQYIFEGVQFTSGRVALDDDERGTTIDRYSTLDEMLRIFEISSDSLTWVDDDQRRNT